MLIYFFWLFAAIKTNATFATTKVLNTLWAYLNPMLAVLNRPWVGLGKTAHVVLFASFVLLSLPVFFMGSFFLIFSTLLRWVGGWVYHVNRFWLMLAKYPDISLSKLTWVFEGFRLLLLASKLENANSLKEYKAIKGEMEKHALNWEPTGSSVDSSSGLPVDYVTSHLCHQLEEAIKSRDGNALVFAIRNAASHTIGIQAHDLCFQESLLTRLTEAMDLLESSPGHLGVDVEIFRENIEDIRRYFGMTALCLSGGGALALAHFGVVKTLLEAGCLPRIISGTSGGSIVAATVCLADDKELKELLMKPELILGRTPLHYRLGLPPAEGFHDSSMRESSPTYFEPFHIQLLRFVTAAASGDSNPSLISSESFAKTMKEEFGNMTFLQQYKKTGRVLVISVSAKFYPCDVGLPAEAGGSDSQPLILSYVSSPHVLIYSAVTASCCLPGLMAPTTLLALNSAGETVSFHPPGIATLDGSLRKDIPSEELSLCFHCRRFIVSQVNLHVTMLLPPLAVVDVANAKKESYLIQLLEGLQTSCDEGLRSCVTILSGNNFFPRIFGQNILPLATQTYTAGSGKTHSLPGITLVPKGPFLSLGYAFSQPTPESLNAMCLAGERATWPVLSLVDSMTSMERLLLRCSQILTPVQEPAASFGLLHTSQMEEMGVLKRARDESSAEEDLSELKMGQNIKVREADPDPHLTRLPGTPNLTTPLQCVDWLSRLDLCILVTDRSAPNFPVIYSSPSMGQLLEGPFSYGKRCSFVLSGYGTSWSTSRIVSKAIKEGKDHVSWLLNYSCNRPPYWMRMFVTTASSKDSLVN